MTIDLGFAWMTLPSGRRISFVDVPGHRRFMGNMLAGVGPVDAALLVVAADEGWMPQSEEHLAVLDLLGVDRAVVALTKSDRVEAALLPRRIAEISEHLVGTTLEGVPGHRRLRGHRRRPRRPSGRTGSSHRCRCRRPGPTAALGRPIVLDSGRRDCRHGHAYRRHPRRG